MIRNALYTAIGIALGFLAGFLIFAWPAHQPPKLTTEYQLVLLANGQTYFGKLQRIGSAYPVLQDVFYIQSEADRETKKVKNSLIKRGKEWHEPDSMILDARQIVLIEPVKPTSTVAKLIREYKGQ
ncbi:MAG TPA: hypothetical protein VJN43_20170 [Bryobacteraceae bacterium]|nr:hypothetical protein [Bryobacteraceae bacterium]